MNTQEKTWKEFDLNPITHSAAHYLMTIHELHQENGYARVTDVAKKMNITKGSCSISLKALKKKGFIEEDDNRFLKLSKQGKELVILVEQNDQLLETLLIDVLGVNKEQAVIDACKMEHLLSRETSLKLAHFLKVFTDGGKTINDLKKMMNDHDVCDDHDPKSCSVCTELCWYDKQQ